MPYREGFGPLLEDTSQVEWDSAVALEEEIPGSAPSVSRRSSSSR